MPRFSPAEFASLCNNRYGVRPGPGGWIDINECEAFPRICNNGICINADGSFRCECRAGYRLDATGRNCVGECTVRIELFTCSSDFRSSCADIDECRDRSSCGSGRCTNVVGSFQCDCFDGFTNGPDITCVGQFLCLHHFLLEHIV